MQQVQQVQWILQVQQVALGAASTEGAADAAGEQQVQQMQDVQKVQQVAPYLTFHMGFGSQTHACKADFISLVLATFRKRKLLHDYFWRDERK